MAANLNFLTILRAKLQHVDPGLRHGGHPRGQQEVGHVGIAQVEDGAHPESAEEVLKLFISIGLILRIPSKDLMYLSVH